MARADLLAVNRVGRDGLSLELKQSEQFAQGCDFTGPAGNADLAQRQSAGAGEGVDERERRPVPDAGDSRAQALSVDGDGPRLADGRRQRLRQALKNTQQRRRGRSGETGARRCRGWESRPRAPETPSRTPASIERRARIPRRDSAPLSVAARASLSSSPPGQGPAQGARPNGA